MHGARIDSAPFNIMLIVGSHSQPEMHFPKHTVHFKMIVLQQQKDQSGRDFFGMPVSVFLAL